MKLLVAPHNDDEVLFAAFTILREKPLVVIVFDGHNQENRGLKITAAQRRTETKLACEILGAEVQFLGFRDDRPPSAEIIRARLAEYRPSEVYAPAWETTGHAQHNLIAEVCYGLPVVESYLTYTNSGKSISGRPAPIKQASWIALKLRALACYESQMSLNPIMACWPHFLRGQEEYYAVKTDRARIAA